MTDSSAMVGTAKASDCAAGERKELPMSHYRFVPIEEAIIPPQGLINHLKDRWWVVHPEKGLAYYIGANGKHSSPQCNGSEATMRHYEANCSWAEIRFIPSVFHKIDPQDYC